MSLNDVADYVIGVDRAMKKLPLDTIVTVCEKILKARSEGGVTYIIGDGGSASVSDHLACDLSFVLSRDLKDKIKASSLIGNASLITAIANDIGFINIYRQQLEGVINPTDLLIVFSTSGNSPNLKTAVTHALRVGAYVIGVLGPTGGALKDIVNTVITVKADNVGAVEDIFSVISHAIVYQLREELRHDSDKNSV